MQGGVRPNNKVMVTQSLLRMVDQKIRKLKKYPIGPLYTSVLFLMCKFHWSRIHLRLVTRGERGRGRAGPREAKISEGHISYANFFRELKLCPSFSPWSNYPMVIFSSWSEKKITLVRTGPRFSRETCHILSPVQGDIISCKPAAAADILGKYDL